MWAVHNGMLLWWCTASGKCCSVLNRDEHMHMAVRDCEQVWMPVVMYHIFFFLQKQSMLKWVCFYHMLKQKQSTNKELISAQKMSHKY